MGAELVLTEREELQEGEKRRALKAGGGLSQSLGHSMLVSLGRGLWSGGWARSVDTQTDVRGPCCEPHTEALSGLGSWTSYGLR